MIDPVNVTNYKMSVPQLEEFILFWVCAAGKNGVTTARCLDELLANWRQVAGEKSSPFEIIKYIDKNDNLPNEMRKHGIGCYNNKAETFRELVKSKMNLKTCSVEDLEKIKGIGAKTARCFLIHSRPNQKYAALDTHVLKFLKEMGYDTPKTTPPSGRVYAKLEKIFLSLAEIAGKDVAEFDLMIWNAYSGNKGKLKDILAIFTARD